jgi:hypothetical protein
MYDSYGDGWTFTNFAILDSNGLVVDGAFDSLCSGTDDSRTYCVSPGCYTLEVSRGYFPQEVGWLMCGTKGGAPFTGEFPWVDAEYWSCMYLLVHASICGQYLVR